IACHHPFHILSLNNTRATAIYTLSLHDALPICVCIMNFELTREQQMIKEMVRDFANNVIQPEAIAIDTEAKFPEHIFKQMGELGLLGITFPEEYGGSGGDTISYALAVEEIGRVCGSTGLSYAAAVSLGATPIYLFGTEGQKQTYL